MPRGMDPTWTPEKATDKVVAQLEGWVGGWWPIMVFIIAGVGLFLMGAGLQPKRRDDERSGPRVPPGWRKYKETRVFTEKTVPRGLLARHSVKADKWGKCRVLEGASTWHARPPSPWPRCRHRGSVLTPGTTACGVLGPGSLDMMYHGSPAHLQEERVVRVPAGGVAALPPGAPHSVILTGPVQFLVEFYEEGGAGAAAGQG